MGVVRLPEEGFTEHSHVHVVCVAHVAAVSHHGTNAQRCRVHLVGGSVLPVALSVEECSERLWPELSVVPLGA